MENIIELTNVTKKYGRKVALNNVNLTVPLGEIIGLLGPNGSGKTTLLKVIMKIIREQSGTVKINNESASYETRRFISYMPDREFLYDTMKVKDAISYYQDMFLDFDFNKSDELCKKLGLNKEDLIKTLSKGNREKVVLMLTLSRKVKLYLLDEPLGSLDPVIKYEMLNVIKGSINNDCTIIISTHLIKDTEEILDSVIFLKEGQVIKTENVKEITKENKTVGDLYLEVFANV